jgi:uncharacterized membrane protein HdeD (DUF308 family)
MTMSRNQSINLSITLARSWWSLVIRGLAAISLGLITLVWREITLHALALVFFGYAMIDGVVSVAGAVRAAEANQRWRMLLFEGLAGTATAIFAVAWPSMTDFSLVYWIAAWAFVTGIPEIVAAQRLRRHVAGEWLLALSGVASLMLGILMIALPLAGALAIARWIGAYAFIFGALLIGWGFRLRPLAKAPAEAPAKVPGTSVHSRV